VGRGKRERKAETNGGSKLLRRGSTQLGTGHLCAPWRRGFNRAAARHKFTTNQGNSCYFFHFFDLRRPQVEQNATCDGTEEPSQVMFCLTCGRRKSKKGKNESEKGNKH